MEIVFIIGLVIIIVIIVLIVKKFMDNKFYYLNTNSTYATRTGFYNASDLGYEEMRMLRNEKLKTFEKIKRLVNAPKDAKVILNSGATESIATCINWAKRYNKYGAIYGTKFDHSSIKKNCLNQEMKYILIEDDTEFDNASGIFLTHVNSKNGEILDDKYLNIPRKLKSLQYAKNEFEIEDDRNVTPFKPLIFLDATQSITKIPINMEEMEVDALFFSLHKIGGQMNSGILIISEPKDKKFIPLIAGEQNDELRGGTMNETKFVEDRDIFKPSTPVESRIEIWESMANEIEASGLKLIRPEGKHLYNTFLIDTEKNICPMKYVDELARKNIYVGTASACQNEEILKGGNPESADSLIRISFTNPKDVDKKCISTICKTIKSLK